MVFNLSSELIAHQQGPARTVIHVLNAITIEHMLEAIDTNNAGKKAFGSLMGLLTLMIRG